MAGETGPVPCRPAGQAEAPRVYPEPAELPELLLLVPEELDELLLWTPEGLVVVVPLFTLVLLYEGLVLIL